ncbi:MAG: hypothetical protein WBF93_15775 [Pirellulales bacterium]|nr:hypothetical protein [Pirellulales bacterium]
MGKTEKKPKKKPGKQLLVDETTIPFVKRWNLLISTTNWEKGEIICQWQEQLKESGAPSNEYSNEAWSRRVGGVSPQHVGRLCRVYERFEQTWRDFEGLFWSHFLGSVDWPDAEMWLEGAVQNRWTVGQMREKRWDTLGRPPGQQPRDQDIVAAELDEDVVLNFSDDEAKTVGAKTESVRDPAAEESFGPDFGDERPAGEILVSDSDEDAVVRVKPFAQLAQLPDDLGGAFESFKLAILRQKSEGWNDLSRDDLLATLEALKELALAP